MGKKLKAFRTTITVPAELKRRMDAADEDINWSALACEAFQAKLGEIAARKVAMTMDNDQAIERLRALQEQEADELFEEGEQAGIAWAKRTATPSELNRLCRFMEFCGADWNELFWTDKITSTLLHEKIQPKSEERADIFWDNVLGDDAHKADESMFLKGFAEGTAEWWETVRREL
jgi:hypothetical protein